MKFAGKKESPPTPHPADERPFSASEDHPNSGMLHETGNGVKE